MAKTEEELAAGKRTIALTNDMIASSKVFMEKLEALKAEAAADQSILPQYLAEATRLLAQSYFWVRQFHAIVEFLDNGRSNNAMVKWIQIVYEWLEAHYEGPEDIPSPRQELRPRT